MRKATAKGYQALLERKRLAAEPVGFDAPASALPTALFDWQRDIVRWALRRGRAAIFADTGLGKTLMQVSWADQVAKRTNGRVLILAPLAVSEQTAAEARTKANATVTVCRTQRDVRDGINITNYEMLSHFDPEMFAGIVLDESSILKSFDGSTRKAITEFAAQISYRLACTATPAPNDLMEIVNHADFLGVMSPKEVMALFFTQDGNTTHAWRLKGHARQPFWEWLASWAVALRSPSDLGYDRGAFQLPALKLHQHTLEAHTDENHLFTTHAVTFAEQREEKRRSLGDRVRALADIVNASDEAWIVWCHLNDESAALVKAIPGAVEVVGADSPEKKAQAMLDFAAGKIRVLVTKPSIAGFGMNWQHCHHVAFVGITHSWEQYYQAVRRCWRFGQRHDVDVHVFRTEAEEPVIANLERKDREASVLMSELVREVATRTLLNDAQSTRDEMVYEERDTTGHDWKLMLGDSVMRMDDIPDESVGLTIFSPPFPGMYAYTNSPHDMGNVRSMEEMLEQYRYLVGRNKLLRVMMPGRMCCIHLTQAPVFKHEAGYVGMRDYRGSVIQLMQDEGWIYYGEVTIDKDPQVKAQRTKERGLMFKTLSTDSSLMRMAMADYLIYFMKPGQNPKPIRAGKSEKYGNPDGWITTEEWIEWAHPVWYGIRETNVLNVRSARDTDDERHLCPLQLDVIERAVKLWSAPGDTVLDPFNGVGSTGAVALKLERKYIGIELKASYYRTAVNNLREAAHQAGAATLWGMLDEDETVDSDADASAG